MLSWAGIPEAEAKDIGQALVRVGTGTESGQSLGIPWWATKFETFPVELERKFSLPSIPDLYHGKGRAIAGIDIADGALYGAISTFERSRDPVGYGSMSVRARAHVAYQEIFEVLSDTLPLGAPVDIEFDLLLRFRGSAGVGGYGNCCLISSTYATDAQFDWSGGAGLPRSSSWRGVLAGGVDAEPIELGPDTVRLPTLIGEQVEVHLSFTIESFATARALWDGDAKRYVPGTAQAAGTAALYLATTVTSPAASFAAAARAPSAAGYLISSANGIELPGREVFDATNLDAHLLPLTPVPEPATAALVALGLAALAACVRTRRPQPPQAGDARPDRQRVGQGARIRAA